MIQRLGGGCVCSIALLSLLVFFLCGLGFLVDEPGRQQRLNSELALRRAWPTTPGRIESSLVEMRKMRRPAGLRAHPAVTYSYTVNGTSYRSSNVGILGDDLDWQGDGAQALVSRFPQGSQIVVHHDPHQPGLAYLLDTEGQATPSRAGWVFIGVSVLGMVFVWRVWSGKI